MTAETVLVPGARDVRATLDESPAGADACVVACPPHPQHRGHRGDKRLVAVADELTAGGVDCLRIDYGEWDEGYGERDDVVDWERVVERADELGFETVRFGADHFFVGQHEKVADAVAAFLLREV